MDFILDTHSKTSKHADGFVAYCTEFFDSKDDPTLRACNPNSPHPTPLVTSQVRPASPSDFDGDREGGQALLNSCTIYFAICGNQFPNDQAHIHWALSYFKSG